MLNARLLILSTCGLALALTGCLERKEHITIRPDLSASIACEFSGDADDWEQGDAMPSEAGGWAVTVTPKEDRKVEATATIDIGAGAPLPGTFAAADNLAALRFPTTLTREDRAGGTYYHFRRVYTHREDARYTWIRRSIEQDTQKRDLFHADIDELSEADRATLIDSLRLIATEQELQHIGAGIAALTARPQDVGLRIRAAAVKASESFDTQAARALLMQPDSEDRDRAITEIADRFLQSMRDAAKQALRAENLKPDEVRAYEEAEARDRAARKVTEDLQDEMWEVKVTMPGRVIAHNGNEADDTTVTWTFDSMALMDRDQPLMVTSRVDKTK